MRNCFHHSQAGKEDSALQGDPSPPVGSGIPAHLPSPTYLVTFPCAHAMAIRRHHAQALGWVVRTRERFFCGLCVYHRKRKSQSSGYLGISNLAQVFKNLVKVHCKVSLIDTSHN